MPLEPTGWQQALLTDINAPITATNIAFFSTLAAIEHGNTRGLTGGPDYGGAFNPIDTTLKVKGSTDLGGPGQNGGDPVQNYDTAVQGIDADAQTLVGTSNYTTLLASLRSGDASLATLESEAHLSGGFGSDFSSGYVAPLAFNDLPAGAPLSKFGVLPSGGTDGGVQPGTGPGVGNVPGDVGKAVSGAASSALSGIFAPLLSWIEEGAADTAFVVFGLILIVVGLVVTFKGPGESSSSPAKDVAAGAVLA